MGIHWLVGAEQFPTITSHMDNRACDGIVMQGFFAWLGINPFQLINQISSMMNSFDFVNGMNIDKKECFNPPPPYPLY